MDSILILEDPVVVPGRVGALTLGPTLDPLALQDFDEAQLSRSGPSGQPVESSQLDYYARLVGGSKKFEP